MFEKPLNYKINYDNKELFLQNTDENIRPSMETLISQIIHVSHDQFIKNIREQISSLVGLNLFKNNTTIFVYLKGNKEIETDYYVYTYFKKFLQEILNKININIEIHTISSLNDQKIQENDMIFFVDDCIYNNEMTETIEELFSNIKDKNKKIHFYFCIQYMSLNAIKKINEICKSYNFKFFRIATKTIYPATDFETILDYYPHIHNIDNSYLNPYLIYFDHKVDENVEILTNILNGLVPNKKNKEIILNIINLKVEYGYDEHDIYINNNISDKDTKINEIKKKLIEDTEKEEKELDFYPLLTNCEHIKKTISESLCIIPYYKNESYKKEYETFLQTFKPKNKIILLQELINNHFQKIQDLI